MEEKELREKELNENELSRVTGGNDNNLPNTPCFTAVPKSTQIGLAGTFASSRHPTDPEKYESD